ncbi:S-layer homology domain-containing protein, partial [Ructibacterium gallinarum]
IPVGDRLEETYTSNNQEVTAELGAPLFTTQVTGNEMSRFGATGADLVGMSHILVNHNDTHKQAKKKFPNTYDKSGNAGYFMYKNKAEFFSMQAAVGGTVYVYTLNAAGDMYNSWTKKELNVGSAPEGYDSWAAVPDGTILEGDQSDVLVRNQYFTASEVTATPYTHVYSRKFSAGDVVSIPTIGQDSYNIVMVLIDWDPLNGDPDPSNFMLSESEEGTSVDTAEVPVAVFGEDEKITNSASKEDEEGTAVDTTEVSSPILIETEESTEPVFSESEEAVSVDTAEVSVPVSGAEEESPENKMVHLEKEVSAMASSTANGLQVNYTIGNTYADISGQGTAKEDVYLVITKAGYTQQMLLEELRRNGKLPEWVYAIENILADQAGTYTVHTVFPLSMESGMYLVSDAAGHQTQFEYTNPQEALQVLTAIVQAAQQKDTAALKAAMQKLSSLDGTNYTLYNKLSDGGKTDTAEELIALDIWPEDTVTLEDMPNVVAAINRAMVVPGFNDGVIESADAYLDYLSEDNEKAGQDYTNRITAEGKKQLTADLSHQNFASMEELKNAFTQQVILKTVAYPVNGSSDILAALTGYPDLLSMNMSAFNKLADAYQHQVLTTLKNARPADLESLQSTFSQAVAAYASTGGTVSKPSGGGGGGSMGGSSLGGGGFTVDNSSNETNDDTNQSGQQNTSVENFADYVDAEWAKGAMQLMIERGIWNGYEDNTLRPNLPVLREEAYKMFICAFSEVDSSAISTFTDVSEGDWFYPYIASAQVKGLTSGIGDGLFGSGQQMSRQDLAVMFYEYVKQQDNLSYGDSISFADASQIADYAAEAVEKLTSLGVIGGYDDGTFRPEDSATRAEMAQMMSRLLDILS